MAWIGRPLSRLAAYRSQRRAVDSDRPLAALGCWLSDGDKRWIGSTTTTKKKWQCDDLDIPDSTLTEYLAIDFAKRGAKATFIDGISARTRTYEELPRRINACANGLRKLGFAKGDCLLMFSPNCIEYLEIFHGAAIAGGIVSPCNPAYTSREVAHQLELAKPKVVITVNALRGIAQDALEEANMKDSVVLQAMEDEDCFVREADESKPPRHDAKPNDVVVLPFSSGTTGRAKGVMLSHRNMVANIMQINDDPKISIGPKLGATVVTMPRFDFIKFLEIMQHYKVTFAPLVPPIIVGLAKHPAVGGYDLSSLRIIFSGAAPLAKELQAEASKRLNVVITQGYGLTELSPVATVNPVREPRLGSAGVAVPNTELRIVSTDGSNTEVKTGELGELWVKGPQVMLGYLNDETATKATMEGDFFKTGDLTYMDEDGYIYVVDRIKELIKVKGFQVPPAELEDIILTHPAVADVVVVGVKSEDEFLGEEPKAFVVLKPGHQATEAEIIEFVRPKVAEFKQIYHVQFLEAIPKTASGKLLRRHLRDLEKK